MKKCPFCAEQIQDDAIKCRYCGSMLSEEPERVLLRIHPSFKPILGRYVLAGTASAGALVATGLAGLPLLALVVALPAFGWAAAFHIRRNRTHYVLTSRNLTVEVGILAKESTHIPLAKIQDVTVRRSFADRLLRIGAIIVESAGESTRVPEIHVDHPTEIARRILSEIEARGPAASK